MLCKILSLLVYLCGLNELCSFSQPIVLEDLVWTLSSLSEIFLDLILFFKKKE